MDHHSDLSRDMPYYTPNWPLAMKTKARVYKGRAGWFWTHICVRKDRSQITTGYPSQAAAFEAALKHARGCW